VTARKKFWGWIRWRTSPVFPVRHSIRVFGKPLHRRIRASTQGVPDRCFRQGLVVRIICLVRRLICFPRSSPCDGGTMSVALCLATGRCRTAAQPVDMTLRAWRPDPQKRLIAGGSHGHVEAHDGSRCRQPNMISNHGPPLANFWAVRRDGAVFSTGNQRTRGFGFRATAR